MRLIFIVENMRMKGKEMKNKTKSEFEKLMESYIDMIIVDVLAEEVERLKAQDKMHIKPKEVINESSDLHQSINK